ncbi:Rad2 nuclease [Serendipita sp. 396]|nr:Rad2 nuclease [Serendipita sp. 396]KAG8781012.1 Rad2 nuclease [Serendipita sp. 397]
MGISGLLPLLKSIQQEKHLSTLKGKTLAVDGYVWLHKGAYGCSVELVTGKPTTKYVDYAMHRVRLLRHYGIEPYLVFDGGPLPAKQGTESERRKKRDEALIKAKNLASEGRHGEARELYVKCVDITPQHVFQLIKVLKAEAVAYVVAPYEADAQLAYLEKSGIVDGILTEDSDLLVFGCKNVYFKLDATTYTITHISRSQFSQVKDINLALWTDTEFRHMAMLSGCDYLEGLRGVGVRTANKLLRKYKTVERLLKFVGLENGNVKVPKGYLEAFKLAELAFLHQRVYDPVSEKLIHLDDPPLSEWDSEKDKFVGLDLPMDVVQQIAVGNICPSSHAPIRDINPSFRPRNRQAVNPTNPTNDPVSVKASGPMDRFLTAKPSKKPRQEPAQNTSEEVQKKKNTPTPLNTRSSGKRTLSGEMEKIQEARQRQKEQVQRQPVSSNDPSSSSRFFSAKTILSPAEDGTLAPRDGKPVASTGKLQSETEAGDVSVGTLVVEFDDEEVFEIDFEVEEIVEQEEGYRSASSLLSLDEAPSSPSSSTSHASSVPSPEKTQGQANSTESEPLTQDSDKGTYWDEDDEVLSSPVAVRIKRTWKGTLEYNNDAVPLPIISRAEVIAKTMEKIAPSKSMLPSAKGADDETMITLAPDLSGLFSSFEQRNQGPRVRQNCSISVKEKSGESVSSQAGVHLDASPLKDSVPESDFDAVEESDYEDSENIDVGAEKEWEEEQERRFKTVAQGWRARFSLGSTKPSLLRRETSLSPVAERRKSQGSEGDTKRARSKGPLQPLAVNTDSVEQKRQAPRPRKSEPSLTRSRPCSPSRGSRNEHSERDKGDPEQERLYKRRRISMPVIQAKDSSLIDLSLDAEDVVVRSKARLQAFRYAKRSHDHVIGPNSSLGSTSNIVSLLTESQSKYFFVYFRSEGGLRPHFSSILLY